MTVVWLVLRAHTHTHTQTDRQTHTPMWVTECWGICHADKRRAREGMLTRPPWACRRLARGWGWTLWGLGDERSTAGLEGKIARCVEVVPSGEEGEWFSAGSRSQRDRLRHARGRGKKEQSDRLSDVGVLDQKRRSIYWRRVSRDIVNWDDQKEGVENEKGVSVRRELFNRGGLFSRQHGVQLGFTDWSCIPGIRGSVGSDLRRISGRRGGAQPWSRWPLETPGWCAGYVPDASPSWCVLPSAPASSSTSAPSARWEMQSGTFLSWAAMQTVEFICSRHALSERWFEGRWYQVWSIDVCFVCQSPL